MASMAPTPWRRATDVFGNVYFFHRHTRERTWDLPKEFDNLQQVSTSRPANACLGQPRPAVATLNPVLASLKHVLASLKHALAS